MGEPGSRRPVAGVALACALVAASVFTLYRPAAGFELMGDDYQWWQHAHAAMHRPILLLADLDTFYRPASTWTLVADRLLLGDSPAGFHLTNLLLHALAGVMLLLAARRLGLPLPESAVVGLVWALSPFSEEPAVSVAIRFQDLLLLSWLGLILAWPRDGVWSRGRMLAVGLCAFLAAASKESWVVTAGLVVALEAAWGRRRVAGWIRRAAPFAGGAVLYTAVYFLAFPGGKGYYTADPHVLAKLPHQLAAFLHLEQLAPLAFPLDWKGLLASAVVGGLAVAAWRRGWTAGVAGTGLLLLPMLPTLLVPYLPTRYTAIPYAGFLLMAAAAVAAARCGSSLPVPARRATAVAGSLVALLVLAAGSLTVRADLRDYGRASRAHALLLEEAAAVAGGVDLGRPLAVIRAERIDPLAEVSRDPRGLPKLFYVRHQDPYGLIDAAALLEWVLHREDVLFRRVPLGAVEGVTGDVLVHRQGGFTWADRDVPDLGAEARRWQASGLRLRVVRPAVLHPR